MWLDLDLVIGVTKSEFGVIKFLVQGRTEIASTWTVLKRANKWFKEAMISRILAVVTVLITFATTCLEARPEPPVGSNGGGGPGGSGSSGPYPPSRPQPDPGYSYGPPQLPPSISVNSYGSATSEYAPPKPAPIIHKHVYVHVPPPDPEAPPTRKPITVPPPQKHYKIVFIKAPSPQTPAPPVIPPLQQNEEKTLVYVLVKKQDELDEIIIPTPAPTPPSKPEVYFIRYKTQKQEAGPYPESGVPSGEYGVPPGPSPSNSYGAPLL
ncbi:uncharacterized protein LOC131688702 [Topomyia yanbarensis]|uniref:uncharacterized protein LOC131688702 n=1 Tax=Topomyia yanbarensis TaxID=2498891 RepID=UPI00273B0690|nr:uncharacterized protein LOC131688702 [Topomyia yanbarensis]